MRDVARLAGVSQPTVSRVLNDSSTSVPISEETRQKVLEAVNALGYRPNMTARSLRTQQTKMIALLIADISNGFYHPIARSVQDVARHYGYDVLIANSDHRYDDEKMFCEAVIRRPVDGIIMVPFHLTTEDLDRFIKLVQTPVIALGEHVIHPKVDVVWVDDERATFEAVSWLLEERRYSQVGFLGVADSFPPGPRRWQGYKKALEQAGLPIESDYISFQGDFTLQSGRRAAQELMTKANWPPVLFAVNDLMAIGMILELQDAGFRIPDDIAIMGFDDVPEASIVRPHLTTMAQPPVEIGQKMAAALFDRILGRVNVPRIAIECSCTLIPRQSA